MLSNSNSQVQLLDTSNDCDYNLYNPHPLGISLLHFVSLDQKFIQPYNKLHPNQFLSVSLVTYKLMNAIPH